jgi:hypothetical protein
VGVINVVVYSGFPGFKPFLGLFGCFGLFLLGGVVFWFCLFVVGRLLGAARAATVFIHDN